MKKIFLFILLLLVLSLVSCKEKTIEVGNKVYFIERIVVSEQNDNPTVTYKIVEGTIKTIQVYSGTLEYIIQVGNGLFSKEYSIPANNVFADYKKALEALKEKIPK